MKLTSLVALVLTLGAVAAPAATAHVGEYSLANTSAATVRPDDRALGVRSHAQQPAVVAYVAQQWGNATTSVRPDDRGGARAVPVAIAEPISAPGDGIAWGDFTIGAAAALAAMALALGAALAVRRGHALGF
jgi:hypothetical protein